MEPSHQSDGVTPSQDGVPPSQDDPKPEDDSSQKPEPRTYSQEDYDRKHADMSRFKQERNDLQVKLKNLEDDKLKKDENWKTLYEQEKGAKETAETKLTNFQEGYFTDKKISEVRTLAIKAGLRSEAESDLENHPMDGVQVERTDHGRTIVHGADTFVETLKRTKPHWFKTDKFPTINPGGGGAPPKETPKELTAKYVVALERTDPKKYRELHPEYLRQLRASKLAQ